MLTKRGKRSEKRAEHPDGCSVVVLGVHYSPEDLSKSSPAHPDGFPGVSKSSPDHRDGFTFTDHGKVRKIHEHCSAIEHEKIHGFPLVSETRAFPQFPGEETRFSTDEVDSTLVHEMSPPNKSADE